MSDDEVCRLTLTATGRWVNGGLKWEAEITTTGRAGRFRVTGRREVEQRLVMEGRAALLDFEADVLQCDTERPAEPKPAPLLPPE